MTGRDAVNIVSTMTRGLNLRYYVPSVSLKRLGDFQKYLHGLKSIFILANYLNGNARGVPMFSLLNDWCFALTDGWPKQR